MITDGTIKLEPTKIELITIDGDKPLLIEGGFWSEAVTLKIGSESIRVRTSQLVHSLLGIQPESLLPSGVMIRNGK